MTVRVLYNLVLVRLGLRKILPAEIINRKEVRECGQDLVRSYSDDILYAEGVESYYARKEVIERLENAAAAVHKGTGLKLLIYELYRSPQKQEWLRECDRKEVVEAHPEFNEQQIQTALNRISARVGSSGHQTGGAVDLTLCKEDGMPLDMGTGYLEHNKRTPTACRSITKEQKKNRQILLTAMKDASFANYPGEWWHFCYGDRMWAAYSREPYAIYDVLKEDAFIETISRDNYEHYIGLDIVAYYSPMEGDDACITRDGRIYSLQVSDEEKFRIFPIQNEWEMVCWGAAKSLSPDWKVHPLGMGYRLFVHESLWSSISAAEDDLKKRRASGETVYLVRVWKDVVLNAIRSENYRSNS